MAKFRLEINCDNAAFEDGPELARILGQLSNQYEAHYPMPSDWTHRITDINGNVVGHAEYTEEG